MVNRRFTGRRSRVPRWLTNGAIGAVVTALGVSLVIELPAPVAQAAQIPIHPVGVKKPFHRPGVPKRLAPAIPKVNPSPFSQATVNPIAPNGVICGLSATLPTVSQNSLVWEAIPSLNEVEMVNQATGAVYGSPIPVGTSPQSITYWRPTVATGHPMVLTADQGSHSVTEIDTVTRSVVATISLPAGSGAVSIAASDSSNYALVVDAQAGRVSVINVATHTYVGYAPGSYTANDLSQVFFDAAGTNAFVIDGPEHKIHVFQASGTSPYFTHSSSYNGGTSFTPVAGAADYTTPTSSNFYVTAQNSTLKLLYQFADGGTLSSPTSKGLFSSVPGAVVISPGETQAYVALPTSVATVTLATGSVATHTGTSAPSAMALSWDGGTIFEGDTTASTVAQMTPAGAVSATETVAGAVSDIATPVFDNVHFDSYYVTGSSIVAVNTANQVVEQTVSDSYIPESLVAGPNGRYVYIGDAISASGGPQIDVLDTSKLGNSSSSPIVATIPLPQSESTPINYTLGSAINPQKLAISPSGDSLLIGDNSNSMVETLDLNYFDGTTYYQKIVATASLKNGTTTEYPADLKVGPDGLFAYAAVNPTTGTGGIVKLVASTSGTKYGYPTSTFVSGSTLADATPGTPKTLIDPVSLAMTTDGQSLVVLDANATLPLAFQFPISSTGTLSNDTSPAWSAGTAPGDIVLSPENTTLYVSDPGANATYAYTLSSGATQFSTAGNDVAQGIGVTPDGLYVVVGQEVNSCGGADGIQMIDASSGTALPNIAIGGVPTNLIVAQVSSTPTSGAPSWQELINGGSNPSEMGVNSGWDALVSAGTPKDAPGASAGINTALNSYSMSLDSLSVPALGLGLDQSLSYDSSTITNMSGGTTGTYGHGWFSSYGMSYYQKPTTGFSACQIQVTQEDGSVAIFNPSTAISGSCPTAGYQPTTWEQAKLTYVTGCNGTDACWVMSRDHSGQSFFIDATTNQLIKETDRNNNAVTLSYSSGKLASVTDAGRTLSYSYPSPGSISTCPSTAASCVQVVDPVGRAVTYVINSSGDLASVNLAASAGTLGAQYVFSYSSHLLTDWWDPNNSAAYSGNTAEATTVSYASGLNQVTQVTGPQVTNEGTSMTDTFTPTTTVSYPDWNYFTETGTIVVSDPNFNWNLASHSVPGANVTLYNYANGGLLSTVQGYGPAEEGTNAVTSQTSTPIRDPLTLLAEETLNSLAGYTQFETVGTTQVPLYNTGASISDYDPDGNLLQSMSPAAAPDSWNTTSYTYNAFDEATSTTDPLGNMTTSNYDSHGNLLTESTPPTEPWVSPSIVSHAYNANGTECANLSAKGHAAGYSLTTCPSSASPYVTRYAYNSFGDETSVIDPLGDTTTSLYDANGRLCASMSPNGNAASATMPTSCPTTGGSYLTVDANFNLYGTPGTAISPTNVTNATGGVTTTTCFDSNGNVLATLAPMGGTASCSTILSSTTALYTSYSSFNPLGEQTKSISQTATSGTQGPTTTTFVDPDGNTVATVSPNGNVSGGTPSSYKSKSTFDNVGETVASTDPTGNQSTTAFDPGGEQVASTIPTAAGQSTPESTSTSYDPAGNVVTSTMPKSTGTGVATATSSYDANGNQTSSASNQTNAGTASAPGTASSVTPSGANCWSSAVPVSGTPTCAQPPTSGGTETTVTYYDADGNKVAVTGPSGSPYQYSGTPSGCNPLTSSTCLDTTYYIYNQADQLVSTTRPADPSGNHPVTTNYYDANGNTIATTGPSGNPSTCNPVTTGSCAGTIYNTFDGANRLTTVVYTDGTPQVANSYNADGTKATVVQGTGGSANTSTYLYDGVGRLLKVTNGAGAITTYAYDTEGHRVCVSYPNATATCSANQASDTGQTGLVTYYYNTNGQLSKMTDWFGTSFNELYDGAGNVCAMSTGGVPSTCTSVPSGGVTESSTFDQQGSLAATTSATGTTPLYALIYTRDNNGNLATSQATIGTTAQSAAGYSYDQQTQVASGPVSSGATGSTNNYTADHGITAAPGFRTASYSPSGQLCWNYSSSSSNACGSTPTGGTGFTYDASGDRLTQFTQGSGSTTTTASFGWSQESERLCWTLAGPSSNACGSAPTGATTYSYDASGLRTTSTTGSTTTIFTWDQGAQDLLADGNHYFIYGLSSTVPTEEIATSGSPVVSDLLIADQIGNVRALIRLTGSSLTNTVTNVTTYDAYGNPIVAPGGPTEPGGVDVVETGLNANYVDTSTFGFGEGYSESNGIIYLLNRYFDPIVAQFVTIDPLLAKTDSPYSYSLNDPANHSDPTGLSASGCTQGWPWDGYDLCFSISGDGTWVDHVTVSLQPARTFNSVHGILEIDEVQKGHYTPMRNKNGKYMTSPRWYFTPGFSYFLGGIIDQHWSRGKYCGVMWAIPAPHEQYIKDATCENVE